MRIKWKDLQNYPNYKISNYGEVFSTRRQRLLKISKDRYGYPRVNLVNQEGVSKNLYVHFLVAITFVEGWFAGAVVNHKDGVKTNCRSTNLEWVTQGDNVRHACATGLRKRRRSWVILPKDR